MTRSRSAVPRGCALRSSELPGSGGAVHFARERSVAQSEASEASEPTEIRRRLEQESDGLRRRLALTAWLSARLAPVGGRVAVVGGGALEFYTHQEYTTADL